MEEPIKEITIRQKMATLLRQVADEYIEQNEDRLRRQKFSKYSPDDTELVEDFSNWLDGRLLKS